MRNIIICDNDQLFAESLKQDILEMNLEEVQSIELFPSGDAPEFLAMLEAENPPVILMDIKLGEKNGIQAAKRIQAVQPGAQIIFMSGYDDYYLDVYEVEHVYFLHKPIDKSKLRLAIERALTHLEASGKLYFVLSGKRTNVRLLLSRILYLEKEKRKIHVYTDSGEYSFYGRFQDIESQLDERFLQCHNSYIVNIGQVQRMGERQFFFAGEKSIPISRTYYKEAKEAFLRYLSQD